MKSLPFSMKTIKKAFELPLNDEQERTRARPRYASLELMENPFKVIKKAKKGKKGKK